MRKYANFSNFIAALRRMRTSAMAAASFSEMLIHNHMAMNCYDIDQDSDIGQHMIIHIPDDWPDMYDGPYIIKPQEILNFVNEYQRKLKDERTDRGLPPKSQRIELEYEKDDKGITLYFIFALDNWEKKPFTEYSFKFTKTKKSVVEQTKEKLINCGEVFRIEKSIKISYVDQDDPIVENILKTYTNMVNRVEGDPVVIDGIENAIYEKVAESVRFYYYPVKINGKKVQVPLIKSMFRGLSKFDEFYLAVHETNIESVYLFVLHFTSKGLTEQHIGYFQFVNTDNV